MGLTMLSPGEDTVGLYEVVCKVTLTKGKRGGITETRVLPAVGALPLDAKIHGISTRTFVQAMTELWFENMKGVKRCKVHVPSKPYDRIRKSAIKQHNALVFPRTAKNVRKAIERAVDFPEPPNLWHSNDEFHSGSPRPTPKKVAKRVDTSVIAAPLSREALMENVFRRI